MNDSTVKVLWSGILAYHPKDNAMPTNAHFHNFFHCFYVVDGMGNMIVGDDTVQLKKGYFYITPPEMIHSFGAVGHSPMILCEIKFELGDGEICTFLEEHLRGINVEDTPIYSILKRTGRELKEKKAFYSEIIEHNMSEVFIHLKRCVNGNGGFYDTAINDDKILQAVLYINSHVEGEITLGELANEVYLEKTYFLKRFKAVMKTTPMKYARIAKMNKAKELLVYSDKTITQISDMLGFKSIHHFSNAFLRDVGVSPSVYKKQNQIT